jgi:hypothetical protein
MVRRRGQARLLDAVVLVGRVDGHAVGAGADVGQARGARVQVAAAALALGAPLRALVHVLARLAAAGQPQALPARGGHYFWLLILYT